MPDAKPLNAEELVKELRAWTFLREGRPTNPINEMLHNAADLIEQQDRTIAANRRALQAVKALESFVGPGTEPYVMLADVRAALALAAEPTPPTGASAPMDLTPAEANELDAIRAKPSPVQGRTFERVTSTSESEEGE